MANFVKVAKASQITDNEGKCVEIEGKRIALFKVDGEFYAIDDTCTHDEGPLSEGLIDGDEVICPWHQAVFNIKTGKSMGPPAKEDVVAYRVRVTGEDVEVEV